MTDYPVAAAQSTALLDIKKTITLKLLFGPLLACKGCTYEKCKNYRKNRRVTALVLTSVRRYNTVSVLAHSLLLS